jgi:hypothetical protein
VDDLIEVVLGVGAEHDRVKFVVVFDTGKSRQQNLFLDDVVVRIGVNNQVGRL